MWKMKGQKSIVAPPKTTVFIGLRTNFSENNLYCHGNKHYLLTALLEVRVSVSFTMKSLNNRHDSYFHRAVKLWSIPHE